MKSRSSILVFLFVLTVAVFGIFYGWKLLKVDEQVKSLVKGKLGENIKTLDFSDLKVSFGSVAFKDVNLSSKNGSYDLTIDELRIGFSIRNLFRYGLKPEKSIDEIILFSPNLTLKSSDSSSKKKILTEHEKTIEDIIGQYKNLISNFQFIHRVLVSDGTIKLENHSKPDKSFSITLNGIINSLASDNISLNLDSKFFNSDDLKFKLVGIVDLKNSNMSLKNIITDGKLSRKLSPVLPEFINLNSGILNGNWSINYNQNLPEGEKIWFEGDMDFTGMDIGIHDKLSFSPLDLNIHFQKRDVIIKTANDKINGAFLEINGALHDILLPRWDITLKAAGFNPKKFFNSFNLAKNFDGDITLRMEAKGPFLAPEAVISAIAPEIKIYDKKINDLSVFVNWKNDSLYINDVSGSINTIEFNSQGTAALSPFLTVTGRSKLKGNLGNIINWKPLEGLSLEHGEVTHTITRKKGKIVIEGNFTAKSVFSENILINSGFFQYKNDSLTVSATSDDSLCTIVFQTEFINRNAGISSEINNPFYLLEKFEIAGNMGPFNSQTVRTININKRRKKISFTILGESNNDSKITFGTEFRGSMEISNGKLKGGDIDGWYHIDPKNKEPVKGSFSSTDENFKVNVQSLFGIINGSLSVDTKNDKKINGSLNAYGDLDLIKNLIPLDTDYFRNGTVTGKIDIGRTSDSPLVTGTLLFDSVTFNYIDNYKADLSFSFDDSFYIDKFLLTNGNKTIGSATGYYSKTEGELILDAKCTNVDAVTFSRSFITDSLYMTGSLDLNARYRGGSSRESFFTGNLEVKNGTYYGVPFHRLKAHLGADYRPDLILASITNNGKRYLIPSRVIFDSLSIFKKPDVILTGNAEFPFSKDEDFNIKLSGKGDILSALPDITPFFVNTHGKGSIDYQMGGTYMNPAIKDFGLKVNGGSSNFDAVLNSVNDIRIDIKRIDEDNFFAINKFSGRQNKQTFQFTNQKAVTVKDNNKDIPLEPLIFANESINLGIISFSTGPDGIDLKIPDFMTKGEKGTFIPGGKNQGEKLYFAGPVESPVFRGRIYLKNARFGYPMEASEEPETPFTVFLNSIIWDVKARFLDNVIYYQELPFSISALFDFPRIEATIAETDEDLYLYNSLGDLSFGMEGTVSATRGKIEYLNDVFNIETGKVIWDQQNKLFPMLSLKAKTTIRDTTVYMEVYPFDEKTGKRDNTISSWENFRIRLYSDIPEIGDNQERVLAFFGYSIDDIEGLLGKASELAGVRAGQLIVPLIRPLERKLERLLKIDEISFRPRLGSALVNDFVLGKDATDNPTQTLGDPLSFFRSSELVIRKYFPYNVSMSLSLAAVSDIKSENPGELGINRSFSMEYRISPQVYFEWQWLYNFTYYRGKNDLKGQIKYSFPISDN